MLLSVSAAVPVLVSVTACAALIVSNRLAGKRQTRRRQPRGRSQPGSAQPDGLRLGFVASRLNRQRTAK